MKSFFPPLLFLAAGAVSVPAAEDGAPFPASDAAVAEIAAARERLMLKDGLRDVLARRAAFYAEAETLSENERSRRASDIASRFETLLSRFPESAPALFCFAEFLRDGGETARAEELLLRAEKTDPDFAAAQFLLGEILAAGKSPEKAFPRFSAAVRTAPDAADFHLGFGEYLTDFREVLLEKGIFPSRAELDAAMLGEFRAACAVAPADVDARARFAQAFYDAENPDWNAALSAWNAVGALAEKNGASAGGLLRASVALHRARALAELGRLDEAEALLRGDAAGVPALERSRREVFEIISEKRNLP